MQFFKERAGLFGTLLIIGGLFVFLLTRGSGDAGQAPKVDPFRSVDLTSVMSRGVAEAPVAIVQYSDFLCPSCSIFSTQVMPSVEEQFIKTNQAKFEFRPMAFIADGSLQAGMGAYCAVDQNKFWDYHDAIYGFVANQVFNEGKDPKQDVILTAPIVKEIAKLVGLETATFNTCLDTQQHLSKIVESNNTANSYGVNSTPYIMVNGKLYQGNMTASAFEALVKASM